MPKDTDDAVGVDSPQWYVAIVPPNHETKISDRLALNGYETYVAKQSRLRVYASGRKKWVSQVLIPSKIFIKCTDKERHLVLQDPEVLRFMTNPSGSITSGHKSLAVVTPKEIDTLKFMLGQKDYPVSFQDSNFAKGDPVRIIRGSLKGLEGMVVSSDNSDKEIIVKLELLGCAKVTISTSDLELQTSNL